MATHVVPHAPDLANPEPFYWWWCDCGTGAPKEYADRDGAEIGAEDHRKTEHPGSPQTVTEFLREYQD